MEPQDDDDCPVCHNPLPLDSNASEAHIATCIENQLGHVEDSQRQPLEPSSTGAQLFGLNQNHSGGGMPSFNMPVHAPPEVREEDLCPVCQTSLFSKGIGDSESAREAHVMACLNAAADDQSQPSYSTSKADPNTLAPPYTSSSSSKGSLSQSSQDSSGFFSRGPPSFPQFSDDKNVMGNSSSSYMQGQEGRK